MKNLSYLLGLIVCGFLLRLTAFEPTANEGLFVASALFAAGFLSFFIILFQELIKAIFTYLEKNIK